MCMIVNQLYRQLLKKISSSVKSYADNMVKNSIWKWYQKAIQVVILQKATGSSYALLLSFDSIFVQVVSAGESVIPASSFLDFQMCLFTTSILLREMYPHRLQQGFPALHSLFLLSPFCVAACHSKKRDSRGQDCMPISNWINVCLLSVIFYVLRKSLCSSAQVLSDTLIRRMGQLRVLLLRQKANEGFLLLVIQKRFSHAAHALNQIQIFELFWSLLWYADCLVGEYFNHTKVRYRHFSFHF